MLNVGGPSQRELKILEKIFLRIFTFGAKKIKKTEKKIWQISTKTAVTFEPRHLEQNKKK